MSKEQVKEYLNFVQSVENGDTRIGTNLIHSIHAMMQTFTDYRNRVDDTETIGSTLIKNYNGQFENDFVFTSMPQLAGSVAAISMVLLSATNWSYNVKRMREILRTMQAAITYANAYVSMNHPLSLDDGEKFLLMQANYIGAGIEQMIKYEDDMCNDVDQVRNMANHVAIIDDYGMEESDDRSDRLSFLIREYALNSGMEIPVQLNEILWNQYYMLETEMARRGITDTSLDETFGRVLKDKLCLEDKTLSCLRNDLYEIAHSGKKLTTEPIFSNIDPEDFDEVCFDVYYSAFMTTARVETDPEEAFSQYVITNDNPNGRENVACINKYQTKTLLSDLVGVIHNATGLKASDSKFADYFKEICVEALGLSKEVIDTLIFVNKGAFGYLAFDGDCSADAYFATELTKYTSLEMKIIATEYLRDKYNGADGFQFNFYYGG